MIFRFVFLLLLLLLLVTLLWLLLKISSLLFLLLLVKPASSSSARLSPSDVPFSAAELLLPAVASYGTAPYTQPRSSLRSSCVISAIVSPQRRAFAARSPAQAEAPSTSTSAHAPCKYGALC